jgi:four helix bundle protein
MDAFEKLDVWKRSSRLCVTLYQQLKDSKDWGFRDQTTRSALSVPSNIAEGYERNSRKEYVQFLRIAKGSCGELRLNKMSDYCSNIGKASQIVYRAVQTGIVKG